MAVFSSFFAALTETFVLVLNLYVFVLICRVILDWLAFFEVVNTRNRLIQTLGDMSFRLTEPVLRPLRRFLPVLGGIDLSPIALIVVVWFLQSFLLRLTASL